MIHGTGIYMTENPSYSKYYGNCLILCRVLRPIFQDGYGVINNYGSVVRKNWFKIYVVPDERQILPYCVIELESQPMLHSFSPLNQSLASYHQEQEHLRQVQNIAQGHMVLLTHAHECAQKEIEESATEMSVLKSILQQKCNLTRCAEMKKTLVHMRQCLNGNGCAFPDCAFSRECILKHCNSCRVKKCQKCKLFTMLNIKPKTQKQDHQVAQENDELDPISSLVPSIHPNMKL